MINDVLKSILFAGLPVGLISYFLVLVARKETGATAKNTKLLKQEFKNTEIKQQKFWKAFLYKKWMKFGGGFYGVLTFITYLHIEIYEVIDFVQSFIGTESLIIKSVLVLFVEFFVDSIINFLYAFLWPVYWFKYLPIGSYLVWICVVFICYIAGTRLAISRNLDNHS